MKPATTRKFVYLALAAAVLASLALTFFGGSSGDRVAVIGQGDGKTLAVPIRRGDDPEVHTAPETFGQG